MTTATLLDKLHASEPETLPFARSLEARAFVLERDAGDVLVYSTHTAGDLAAAVSRRYLNHWHEAMFAPETPGAPLFVHAADRAETEKRTKVRGSFTRRHHYDDDIEVIPTPGHTPGATAYLWDSGDHRLLFTGDTLYLRDGEWVDGFLEGSSDRAAYLDSLELIRELDFDVLVPWVAGIGEPYLAETDDADKRRRLDQIIARLRR